jgi:hypothetical protein
LGEGDATGEGLAAGLGLFTGAPLAPDDGLAVVGVFELFSGSVVQPAENAIESVARSSSAVRLIKLTFGVVISLLPRFSKIEKRADDYSGDN